VGNSAEQLWGLSASVITVHTYWYLTITPELVDAVSERVALYYRQGRRR
jgi:hypothetical protein